MSIEWLRDLIICIMGLVATGVLIFLSVLLFSLYRRSRHIMDSVAAILSVVQSALTPVFQVLAVIRGLRQGVDTMSKFFGQKGGR